MSKKVRFGDIPDGVTCDDYPEDTIFVLDDSENEEEEWALAALEGDGKQNNIKK